MPEFNISGIPVIFPFEPYDLQRAYMEKVIECLDKSTNGVLESPTGTGKTLSLLCSTLGWIVAKKAEQIVKQTAMVKTQLPDSETDYVKKMIDSLNECQQSRNRLVPKIIYSSRTHSQLSQAMQEMKRTSYNHLKAAVIGSRDQLCIHPEVSKETSNVSKLHMCKLKVTTRTCSFYHRVEKQKDSAEIRNATILDIEDLITVAGQKLKACPYFLSKELVLNADIIFMPYNYLLDPKARKANNIELNNTIVILDEAHNVEKMCEESTSMQISSTDIALAIEVCSEIMKKLDGHLEVDAEDSTRDFTIDDIAALKELLLKLENVVDGIEVMFSEGSTFPGNYIFEILQKANINETNWSSINGLIDNLTQYLTTVSEKNAFSRNGNGLLKLNDLLGIVFAGSGQNYVQRITQCYKVHIHLEEPKQTKTKKTDGWLSKTSASTSKSAKVVSYWCFNPGFGMYQLLKSNVRSIILTSGTLAPLKPLISELDIPINVRLENPHIIKNTQVCVKIISQGPDKEPLISNFQNRDNPKYVASLGRTILSLCPVCPNGLLIFFPSYPLLNKCQEFWQENGIWSQISRQKQIFVEPRGKEAFINTMTEYYDKINDATAKGAIFMAVCRGKVSEGLDFADINGRAVIITGLPFPPLKDPRVILKKKYLEENRTRENEILSGNDWYSLEAIRAVNQAIGRVIRHRNDYGAILLCDARFRDNRVKSQLSSWIQVHLNMPQSQTFGPIIGELSRFFKNAMNTLPQPKPRALKGIEPSTASQNTGNEIYFKMETHMQRRLDQLNKEIIQKETAVESLKINDYNIPSTSIKKEEVKQDFFSRLDNNSSTIDFNDMSSYNANVPLVKIHKRERLSNDENDDSINTPSCSTQNKKKKYKLVTNVIDLTSPSTKTPATSPKQSAPPEVPGNKIDLIKLVKSVLTTEMYKIFLVALTSYQKEGSIRDLLDALLVVFSTPDLHYLLKGMRKFIKESQRPQFDERMNSKNIQ